MNEEASAIRDLIPEMIDYESVIENYGPETPILYINHELDNVLKISKAQYETMSEIEKTPLAPLTNERMSKRTLTKDIINDAFRIETRLITDNDYQNRELQGEPFEYLAMSRIIFTSDFERGFLTYKSRYNDKIGSHSVISIKKTSGRWTIDEFWEWPQAWPEATPL